MTPDGVAGWRSVQDADIAFTPINVEVASGDTVDALLLANGVRPDDYSRSLVAAINPQLDARLRLRPGQPLTLFQVSGEGRVEGQLIAVQPYQSDRQSIRVSLGVLNEEVASAQWRPLSAAVEGLNAAEAGARLTDPADIVAVATSLERARVGLAQNDSIASIIGEVGSASATYLAAGETAAPAGPTIRVSLSPTASASGNGCVIAWSVAGFSALPGSVDYAEYNPPRDHRVHASELEVWIEKERRIISGRAEVSKERLLAGGVVLVPLTLTEACAS